MPMDLRSLGGEEIRRFLAGKGPRPALNERVALDAFFCQILAKANEFAPSEAGSILLEDPDTRGEDPGAVRLIFVSSFGEKAGDLVGRTIPVREGIVGWTFRSGKSYISREVSQDRYFARDFASPLDFPTRSIVCVPIRIEGEIRGVIELINRRGGEQYNEAELGLLEIFAGYISTAIRNILDARLFHEMARRDDLTGLHNDRWLHHQLREEIAGAIGNGKDLAVLFLDLDNFKGVNDCFGHLAGSQTLREVGRLIEAVMGAPGVTLARYGGDEFVVVLPGAGPVEAQEAAERLRRAIEQKVFLERPGPGVKASPMAGTITASIGVQTLSRLSGKADEHAKDRLLREADAAMYLSKERGKNRVSLFEG
jgi:diguanylate cyclase (GGDEF)-like protein